jgi:hypothetical protein
VRNVGPGADGAVDDGDSSATDALVTDGALPDGTGGDGGDPCQDHCTNGAQDCGEEGVDCGGDCSPCEEGLTIRGRWLGMVDGNGVFRACISTGELRYSGTLYASMTADGKNLINNNASGTNYAANAYVNGNLSAGFNQQFWTDLETHMQEAQALDIGMIVNVFGTVTLECQRQSANCNYPTIPCRWDDNPWNEAVGRGGPYLIDNQTICGKDAFYTFHNYGVFLFQSGDIYPDASDMYDKGQWRQEEYMHRLASLAAGYSNVAISLMWEGYDRGSHVCGNCGTTRAKVDSWHDHMTQFIKSASPRTLVASDYEISNTVVDFVVAHGHWTVTDWSNATHPVVSAGYGARDANGPCPTDPSDPNFVPCMAQVRTDVRDYWATGLQIGSSFWEYTHQTQTLPELSWYFQDLRQFVDTVLTWQDEPGQEVTTATLPSP